MNEITHKPAHAVPLWQAAPASTSRTGRPSRSTRWWRVDKEPLPSVRFLCRRQRGRLWVDCTHNYVRKQNCVELGARLLQMNGMRGASVLAVSALMAVVAMMATTAIVAYGGVKAAIAVRFFLKALCYWFVDLPLGVDDDHNRRRAFQWFGLSITVSLITLQAPGRARCCRQQGRPICLH